MTPESMPVSEPQPAAMSEMSRITGVFFEPKKTFEDIAQKPRWVVPMILTIVFSMMFSLAVSQRVGWDRMMRRQFENNPRTAQLPPEQREAQIAMATKFASVGAIAGPLLGVPIYYLILSALLLAVSAMFSAGVRFKQMFAIVAYAGLTGIVFSVLAIAVAFLKNPDDFRMENPLAFNPGAFLDPDTTSKFVYALASSIDVFAIWNLLLVATGIKAAAAESCRSPGR